MCLDSESCRYGKGIFPNVYPLEICNAAMCFQEKTHFTWIMFWMKYCRMMVVSPRYFARASVTIFSGNTELSDKRLSNWRIHLRIQFIIIQMWYYNYILTYGKYKEKFVCSQ